MVIASSKTGGVLLERLWLKGEGEGKELVQASLECAKVEGILGGSEGEGKASECYTSTYKSHNLVFQRISDVVLFCSGTRDKNHARVAKTMKLFLASLGEQALNKKAITEERVVKNYEKVCAISEDIVGEGVVVH